MTASKKGKGKVIDAEPLRFGKYRKSAHGFGVRPAGGISGINEEEIQVILGVIQQLWLTGHGKLPSVADVLNLTKFPEWKVLSVLAHSEFRERCTLRGIPWPKNWNRAVHDSAVARSRLTPEQVMTLQIVTDPTNKRTLGTKLRQAGVTYPTWRNWMRDPIFAEAVKTTAEEMLQDMVPTTHARVANRADSGDLQAARMLYELTGRHDPNKQQMLELTSIVRLLLEVITRYVTDTVVLERINNDFGVILQGEVPPSVGEIAMHPEVIQEHPELVSDNYFEYNGE